MNSRTTDPALLVLFYSVFNSFPDVCLHCSLHPNSCPNYFAWVMSMEGVTRRGDQRTQSIFHHQITNCSSTRINPHNFPMRSGSLLTPATFCRMQGLCLSVGNSIRGRGWGFLPFLTYRDLSLVSPFPLFPPAESLLWGKLTHSLSSVTGIRQEFMEE